MMKREDIMRSMPTKQLLFWHEKAVTSGGDRYTYFDGKNSRTITFFESEIAKELSTRDDNPNNVKIKKKKR